MNFHTWLQEKEITFERLNQVEAALGGALYLDSRKVKPGGIFIAMQGEKSDGKEYIEEALLNGAVACLVDEKNAEVQSLAEESNAGFFLLPLFREQLGNFASAFFDSPSHSQCVVAVTGTNGKTSTVEMLRQIWQALGKKSASIGTLGVIQESESSQLHEGTTPNVIDVHANLKNLRSKSVTHVAIEASSHGILQGRIAGVSLDTAVFTNLSQEHLDYHATMDEYFAAKKALFVQYKPKNIVINLDCLWGKKLAAVVPKDACITFGFCKEADVFAESFFLSLEKSVMDVYYQGDSVRVETHLLGQFNLQNILGCIAALLKSGFDLKVIADAISKIKPIKGRAELIHCAPNRPLVMVDYAHTPDALNQLLSTVKPLVKGRLLVVFGCGGDRDSSKRSEMAKVVEKFSDKAFVTNDNPRFESSEKIFKDILQGVKKELQFQVISEREEAIFTAIQSANPQDFIVIAGKGHESYQDIKGVKTPFSDQEKAKSALEVYYEG